MKNVAARRLRPLQTSSWWLWVQRMHLTDLATLRRPHVLRQREITAFCGACADEQAPSFPQYLGAHAVSSRGDQCRRIPTANSLLLPEILPYSEIDRLGAGMYRGEKRNQAGEATSVVPDDQSGQDGATPIHPLLNSEPAPAHA